MDKYYKNIKDFAQENSWLSDSLTHVNCTLFEVTKSGEILTTTNEEISDQLKDEVTEILNLDTNIHNQVLKISYKSDEENIYRHYELILQKNVNNNDSYCGILKDTTEFNTQISRHKINKELLHRTEELSQTGHWQVDIDKGDITWSDEVFRIHGISPEESSPNLEKALNFYHKDDRQEVQDLIQKAVSSGKVFEFIKRITRRDGVLRWVHCKGYSQKSPSGQVSTIFGILQDVTDKITYQKSLENLNSITSDPILTFTEKCLSILKVGAEAFSLPLGIISDIHDNTYTIMHAISPEGNLEPKMTFNADETYCIHTLNNNKPTTYHHVKQSNIRTHPCYKNFGLESYIGCPIFVFGEPVGTINFSSPSIHAPFNNSDISLIDLIAQWLSYEMERNITEERMEQALRAQKEATKAKSEFLANMSHEIRTPMNGILGMSELLLQTELSEQQNSYLDTLHQSTITLLTLIDDILDYSKIEAGKLDLDNHQFNLTSTLKHSGKLFQRKIEEKGLKFSINISPDTPQFIDGDSTRIQQILNNLLSNAIKFTQSGEISIDTSTLQNDGKSCILEITATDSGIGMSTEQQEKIFEKFTQADTSTTRKFGGTGLGLAISKHLSEIMGGDLTVSSTEGKGSAFTLTIPVKISKDDETKEEPKTDDSSKNIDLSHSNILIVEDNPVNQKICDIMLRQAHASPVLATNGIEAIKKVKEQKFDLIFMDIQMPEMDGEEATRIIRKLEKDEKLAHCPIIAFTANAMPGDKEKFLSSGLDDYLPKPFTQKQLLQIVQKFIKT